jgi:hypothetical protein
VKSRLGFVIGRRNRLPHHDKASIYSTVGQAVSPVERLFTQTRQLGAIAVPGASPKLTHAAELPTNPSKDSAAQRGRVFARYSTIRFTSASEACAPRAAMFWTTAVHSDLFIRWLVTTSTE